MGAPLQWPLVIGIAGVTAGLLIAALSLGLSRLPVWRHGRNYAVLAVTAAGYSAADLVMLGTWPPRLVAFGVQVACLFALAHAAAWLAYLTALEGRTYSRTEVALFGAAALTALIGLIPGTLMTADIVTIRVAWAAVEYRTPQPIWAGLAAYGYFGVVIVIGAWRAWRRRTTAGPALIGGLAALGVTALNDTLVSAGWLPMPLLLDTVSVVVVVAVAVDNQRRLAGELADTQQALAQSQRVASISRLAAGIAHEINNPLAILRHGLGQIAAGARDPSRQVAYAMAAVDRIGRVVRQFSDLGLSARPGTAAVAALDVAGVVGRAVQAAGSRFEPGVLTVDVSPGLTASADAARLEAVLVALLDNAGYAVAARRVTAGPARVRVRAVQRAGRIDIDVTDNGPGLPSDVRQRLFEPFVNTHPFGQGAGLGLAVAYGLMRSQGGTLSLVDSTAHGTTFRVDLPRAAVAPEGRVASPGVPKDDLRTIGVLIIDDDPELLAVLGDAAEAYRFRPTMAATVADALEAARRATDLDVVLCDLMMPDGGALTWLRLAEREHPALAARTLVITGGPSSAEALAFADAHPERILYKPFAMADVRAAVWRLLHMG